MSYFQPFPKVRYQFPNNDVVAYKDLSIRPAIVEQLIGGAANLETYDIKDGETPEIIAYKMYENVNFNWAIMLVNNIMNLYTDWPKTTQHFEDYMYDKYRFQKNNKGDSVTLTDSQVEEFTTFSGTPSNDYRSQIDLNDSEFVTITPHHFVDFDRNYYTYGSHTATEDAFGRPITGPELFPISIWAYEEGLNDEKRTIFLPSMSVVRRMDDELKALVNGR